MGRSDRARLNRVNDEASKHAKRLSNCRARRAKQNDFPANREGDFPSEDESPVGYHLVTVSVTVTSAKNSCIIATYRGTLPLEILSSFDPGAGSAGARGARARSRSAVAEVGRQDLSLAPL